MPLGFAPFDVYPLPFVLLAFLLWLWLRQPRRAFFRGWLFGLGQFGVGVHWIYNSLHDFGGAAPPFAVLCTLALVAYLALFPALTAWLAATLFPERRTVTALLLFPALWTLSEWLREYLLTGFPWLALGFSQIDSPLSGWAPLGGIMAVSFSSALVAGVLLEFLTGPRRARLFAAAVALTVVGGGHLASRLVWSGASGEPISVALVQGNIAQDLKWTAEWRDRTLERYLALSFEAPPVDLLVWPETALPAYLDQLPAFTERLATLAAARGTQVLTGAPSRDPSLGTFHNSLVLLGPDGGTYHKVHLVPFGEYLPLRWVFEFFEAYVRIPMADFSPGRRDQPHLTVAGVPISTSICYEVIFGNQFRQAARGAAILINVSNDAWFGDSFAPHQHLQMARMRALENARPLLRGTNNGISAILDSSGAVTARSEQFTATVLSGSVRPHAGETPFSRLGYWPLGSVCVLVVVVAVLVRMRLR